MATTSETMGETTGERAVDGGGGAELVWLDPRVLAEHPGSNVRDGVGDVGELAASIREVGVIQALTVEVDGDGYRLVAGRRRTAAAIEAGLAVVPCLARRVSEGRKAGMLPAMQVAENDQRLGLSTGERARAMEQMSLGGLSQARIAKATGHKMGDVRRHLAVARCGVAVAAAQRCELTLEQASAIAEFADDEGAVEALTTAAEHHPYRFDHVVSSLRRDRERAEQQAKAADQYRSEHPGVTVVADRDGLPADADAVSALRTADGELLDEAEHESCPGHVVAPHPWGTGLVAYCCDPEANGHCRPAVGRGAKPTTVDGHMTAEALAERREVIANNRAWLAATDVRLRYVRELLQRKTAPKGALRLVVTELLVRPGSLSYGTEDTMLALLGVTRSAESNFYGRTAAAEVVADAASDNRLLAAALAQVAATHEDTMGKDTWRRSHDSDAARWLRFLASSGYGLSEVEQLVIDKDDAVTSPPADTDPSGDLDDGDTPG